MEKPIRTNRLYLGGSKRYGSSWRENLVEQLKDVDCFNPLGHSEDKIKSGRDECLYHCYVFSAFNQGFNEAPNLLEFFEAATNKDIITYLLILGSDYDHTRGCPVYWDMDIPNTKSFEVLKNFAKTNDVIICENLKELAESINYKISPEYDCPEIILSLSHPDWKSSMKIPVYRLNIIAATGQVRLFSENGEWVVDPAKKELFADLENLTVSMILHLPRIQSVFHAHYIPYEEKPDWLAVNTDCETPNLDISIDERGYIKNWKPEVFKTWLRDAIDTPNFTRIYTEK